MLLASDFSPMVHQMLIAITVVVGGGAVVLGVLTTGAMVHARQNRKL